MDYAAVQEYTASPIVAGGIGHAGVAARPLAPAGSPSVIGYADLGADLAWVPGAHFDAVLSPRVSVVGWGQGDDGVSASVGIEQASVGITAAHQRFLLAAGIARPPYGVESVDEWFNAVPIPSRVRVELGPRRVLGLAATASFDDGWNLVADGGFELEDRRFEDPTCVGEGCGASAPAVDLASDPAAVLEFAAPGFARQPVVGLSAQRNDIAWEMRAGLTFRPGECGDGRDRRECEGDARFGMQWFPMNLLTLTLDGGLTVGAGGVEAVAQLVQVEVAPHAPVRVDGRFEYAGGPDVALPGPRAGLGIALASSGSALRLAAHVDWDLQEIAASGRLEPRPATAVVDVAFWAGSPHDRELGSIDPARFGLASDPRRIFGEQP